jgi:Cu/Ag efflux pump CusA
MIFGIGETRNADVDVFPEFAPPQVEIQTIAVGNSSQQVEELITIPLEDQLNGIPGLVEMRSKSVIDLSQIQLIFSRDTDPYEARQLVQERLTAAAPTLPTWEPSFHDASAVVDEPDHEDRAYVGRAEHERDVHGRLLEDQAGAAARGRRGERDDLR